MLVCPCFVVGKITVASRQHCTSPHIIIVLSANADARLIKQGYWDIRIFYEWFCQI